MGLGRDYRAQASNFQCHGGVCSRSTVTEVKSALSKADMIGPLQLSRCMTWHLKQEKQPNETNSSLFPPWPGPGPRQQDVPKLALGQTLFLENRPAMEKAAGYGRLRV